LPREHGRAIMCTTMTRAEVTGKAASRHPVLAVTLAFAAA
jgi:hypothetical protein